MYMFLKALTNFTLVTWSTLGLVWTILAYSMIPHYSYWLGWVAGNGVWLFMWWKLRKQLRTAFSDWQRLEMVNIDEHLPDANLHSDLPTLENEV
jgi:hypothetical protein